MNSRDTAKKVAVCGIFTALALIIYTVELSFPPLVTLPGVKPGFANIITTVMLFLPTSNNEQYKQFSVWEIFAVMFIRVVLGCTLAGRLSSLAPGLCGGVLALTGGVLLRRTLKFGCVVTSTAAGVLHNVGQIIAVVCGFHLRGAWAYLPFLAAAGAVCGFATGVLSMFAVRRLSKVL